MARRRMNGSATDRISIAVRTRVGTPWCSSPSCSASAVHHGGEHAHVVGGGAIHAPRAARHAAEDVAAADDDGDLHAEIADLGHFLGDAGDHGGIHAVPLIAHQGFAGQLEEDAGIRGR